MINGQYVDFVFHVFPSGTSHNMMQEAQELVAKTRTAPTCHALNCFHGYDERDRTWSKTHRRDDDVVHEARQIT